MMEKDVVASYTSSTFFRDTKFQPDILQSWYTIFQWYLRNETNHENFLLGQCYVVFDEVVTRNTTTTTTAAWTVVFPY
jgi:hypothetical protein